MGLQDREADGTARLGRETHGQEGSQVEVRGSPPRAHAREARRARGRAARGASRLRLRGDGGGHVPRCQGRPARGHERRRGARDAGPSRAGRAAGAGADGGEPRVPQLRGHVWRGRAAGCRGAPGRAHPPRLLRAARRRERRAPWRARGRRRGGAHPHLPVAPRGGRGHGGASAGLTGRAGHPHRAHHRELRPARALWPRGAGPGRGHPRRRGGDARRRAQAQGPARHRVRDGGPGHGARLRRRGLVRAHGRWRVASGRAHRRRHALRALGLAHRHRGPRAHLLGLSRGPRAAHAARATLQRRLLARARPGPAGHERAGGAGRARRGALEPGVCLGDPVAGAARLRHGRPGARGRGRRRRARVRGGRRPRGHRADASRPGASGRAQARGAPLSRGGGLRERRGEGTA